MTDANHFQFTLQRSLRLMRSPILFATGYVTLQFLLCGGVVLAQPDPVSLKVAVQSQATLAKLREGELSAALDELGLAVDERGTAWRELDTTIASAAGGVHRVLAQLSADEQYDILAKWSLPADGRKHVRLLTTPVPRIAPPKDFARVLGERPRDESFAVANLNGIPGLFCSGWMLVKAADDTGRLSRLIADLEPLAAQNAPNAAELLLLARMADRRTTDDQIMPQLQQRLAVLRQQLEGNPQVNTNDIALAAAAMSRPALRGTAEDLFGILAGMVKPGAVPRLTALLRTAQAVAMQWHRGESKPEVLLGTQLTYWIPVTGGNAKHHASGAPSAVWLSHEEHLLHLSGTGDDVLFCRFPLTGEYQFNCETQAGGDIGTDGGLTFGGLSFEATGQPLIMTIRDADSLHAFQKPCYFIRRESRPQFNRHSIRSTASDVEYLVNLHPMWFDREPAAQSPWIGLRSFGDRRPLFRNLEFKGTPVIPREVPLTVGNELRGWQSAWHGATQPSFVPRPFPAEYDQPAHPEVVDQPNWQMEEGVVHANRREVQPGGQKQNMLRYQRPLLDGESIQYEFHYVPGEEECHPALGRLAFLLEPGGVRIHWITDTEFDWTGLPADNATLEPLNRRGPRPLPLKEKEWNRVELRRSEGKINLLLNDELIYVRSADFAGDLCFGVYHDCSATSAVFRSAVMTGDWPETLPEDFLKNPTATVDAVKSTADAHTRERHMSADSLADNVQRVIQRAAALEPGERYEFLADWVLPGESHAAIRMTGMFSQTQPSPLARQTAPEILRTAEGANLIVPAIDLIAAARDIDKLQELQTRVAALPIPVDPLAQRSRSALLILLALEQGDTGQVDSLMAEFQQLVGQYTPTSWHEVWPEAIVAIHGCLNFADQPGMLDLGAAVNQHTAERLTPPGSDLNLTHITQLHGLLRHINEGGTVESYDAPPKFRDWIISSREWARTRGQGAATSRWQMSEKWGLEHLAGHQEEYVFYRTPLRDDFEVAGDIFVSRTTQLLIGGKFWGPHWEQNKVESGTYRLGAKILPLDPPAGKLENWVPFRARCINSHLTISLFGRVVYEQDLEKHEDPWLAMHSWWRNTSRVKDLQVFGPTSPRPTVVLSGIPGLQSWIAYYGESVEGKNAQWNWRAQPDGPGEITGEYLSDIAGSYSESLLRYERPFVENGTIQYDFWYEPGKYLVHPAVDRLVFLLDPAGVRTHWVTDSEHDTTGVLPDNSRLEPENIRGEGPLPLLKNDWNHLALQFQDDTVKVVLNQQLVYERHIEPENLRKLGLFYFCDQTAVRVRNLLMTGDWPQTAPSISEQELTDQRVPQLNAERDSMPSVFHHDFAQGVPEEYFHELGRVPPGAIQAIPGQGVRQHVVSDGGWSSVVFSPRFTVHGDFDFEAEFSGIDLEHCDGQSEIALFIHLEDGKEFRLGRNRQNTGTHFLKSQLSLVFPDGGRNYQDQIASDESLWGRSRIARRGDKVTMLFAQGDSARYRVIGEWKVSDSDVPVDGIRLSVVAAKQGYTTGFWQSITLRAHTLGYLPPEAGERRSLFVMDSNGSNMQRILEPLPGLTHLGSPEWSADDSQIALDMSTGSTTTSRIVLLNSDGTNVRNICGGCMPSFSKDGKRLATSVTSGGIVLLNADGSNPETIDRSGWGVQWSPDGKYLAYGKSGNVVLHNVETGEQRTLLNGEFESRYSYVYWNLGWAYDSSAIAFCARRQDGQPNELVVAEVAANGKALVLMTPADDVAADVAWTADSQFVTICKPDPAAYGAQILVIPRDGSAPPQLLTQETRKMRVGGLSWSHDGKRVAFVVDEKPVPLPWPIDATSAE